MLKYRSTDGDIVDDICYRYYGNCEFAADVYAHNSGLAEYGPVLPAGVVIDLPDFTPVQKSNEQISLYD